MEEKKSEKPKQIQPRWPWANSSRRRKAALFQFVLLALVNLGAAQRNAYWDFTSRKVFSLAPQSVQVAQDIKSTIRVLAFYAKSEPELANVEELVLRYQQHIKLTPARKAQISAQEQRNK